MLAPQGRAFQWLNHSADQYNYILTENRSYFRNESLQTVVFKINNTQQKFNKTQRKCFLDDVMEGCRRDRNQNMQKSSWKLFKRSGGYFSFLREKKIQSNVFFCVFCMIYTTLVFY